MEELLRLLTEAEDITALSDEDLAALHDAIVAESGPVMDGDATDEVLEVLARARDLLAGIRAEQTTRSEQAAARAASMDEIRRDIVGETDPDEVDPDAEPEPADPEAEPAAEPEATTPPVADAEPEPVAAAATPAPRAPRATRVAARRPAAMSQPPARPGRPLSLVASANLPNVQAGTPLQGEVLAQAFVEAFTAAQGYRGPRAQVSIGRVGSRDTVESLYGRDRTLNDDLGDNMRKIAAVTSPEALVASGGICVPTPVRYDLPVVGDQDRPVRDQALTGFGVTRGGIRTLPPPTIEDVTGAVDVWTNDNDQVPVDPTEKPCLSLDCPVESETIVEAITRCVEIGNFRARNFPEQVAAWVELAAVWHARFAESRLLDSIAAGSKQVTSGQILGASIDVLTTLDRAVTHLKSRHRISVGLPLTWAIPWWLINMIRVDLTRSLTGGTYDEKMAVADAMILRWIEVRGVNVVTFLDGETGSNAIFGEQGDGPLAGWPSTVATYLYPTGSWLFLDGGMLDLGIIRDSELTKTNDYRIFMETFEAAHFHGVESWKLTLDLCPDGSVSGTVDIDPCSTGS